MSKIIPSSYELLQFYVYYLDWVNRSNVKDNAMFSKNICLTESIFRYWHTGRKCTHSEAMRIVGEYLEQLQKAELPVLHPFNESKEELEQECREGKCHLNEKRIEWVRQRLADAGVEIATLSLGVLSYLESVVLYVFSLEEHLQFEALKLILEAAIDIEQNRIDSFE